MDADGHAIEAEEAVRKLITESIFGEFVTAIEVVDPELLAASVNTTKTQPRKTLKVLCDYSAVIVGLKTYLTEVAADLVVNATEDFFNPNAAEFKPTKELKPPSDIEHQLPPHILEQLQIQARESSVSDSDSANVQISADGKMTIEEKKKQDTLEKKRQISQMYQYYNYLIFERNKDSFNDINPDLRKMTHKYDNEVKNAYMTVQASPEVIKAAMGIPPPNQQPKKAGERIKYSREAMLAVLKTRELPDPLESPNLTDKAKEILQTQLFVDAKSELKLVK